MGLLRPCFARTQAWQQAVEYTAVLAGDLPRRNGWTIAQYVGDRAPNRTQRLLNRAVWDGEEAMGLVRRFVVEGLSVATGRRRRGLVVGALDETGQQNVVCGDEVYGGCTQLREFLERHGQAYVLRVACTFMLELGDGARLTCRQAVARLLGQLPWEVRSAGAGSKGQRWYAWAGIATACPHHLLLVRRHLRSGDLAFHYCYLPDGRASMTKLIRAAGLRWPVEEDFEFGKDQFGLDQCQARLYTAIRRHTVLVMAALAICAVAAAQLRDRTDTQAPPPTTPDQAPPPDPGLIPLTVPETKRLLAAALDQPKPPGHIHHWMTWRRRHQPRSRWFHQRTRLGREYAVVK